jgi:hypothetical protein
MNSVWAKFGPRLRHCSTAHSRIQPTRSGPRRAWLAVTAVLLQGRGCRRPAGGRPTVRSCRRGLVPHDEDTRQGISGGNSPKRGGSTVRRQRWLRVPTSQRQWGFSIVDGGRVLQHQDWEEGVRRTPNRIHGAWRSGSPRRGRFRWQ